MYARKRNAGLMSGKFRATLKQPAKQVYMAKREFELIFCCVSAREMDIYFMHIFLQGLYSLVRTRLSRGSGGGGGGHYMGAQTSERSQASQSSLTEIWVSSL